MTIDDVVRLFSEHPKVQPRRLGAWVIALRCSPPEEKPAVDVIVSIGEADPVSIVTHMNAVETLYPERLAARLLVAAEVVETLRASGVVDGQRVGGA